MESNDNQNIFITHWKPRHFIPVEAILLTTLYPNKDISLMDNRFLEHADFTLSQFYILNKINDIVNAAQVMTMKMKFILVIEKNSV